jgi:hypothetical protein
VIKDLAYAVEHDVAGLEVATEDSFVVHGSEDGGRFPRRAGRQNRPK